MSETMPHGGERYGIAESGITNLWYVTNGEGLAIPQIGPFDDREGAVRAREELRARDEQEARSQFVGVPSNHIEI